MGPRGSVPLSPPPASEHRGRVENAQGSARLARLHGQVHRRRLAERVPGVHAVAPPAGRHEDARDPHVRTAPASAWRTARLRSVGPPDATRDVRRPEGHGQSRTRTEVAAQGVARGFIQRRRGPPPPASPAQTGRGRVGSYNWPLFRQSCSRKMHSLQIPPT